MRTGLWRLSPSIRFQRTEYLLQKGGHPNLTIGGGPMRCVKRCQESIGRMKEHRDSDEFKVTAVKTANAPDIETKAVAEALNIHPSMLSHWKMEYRD